MEKENIIAGLKAIKENSQKRNFKQSIDLIFNLKDLNLKNPEHAVNLYIPLHYSRSKTAKVCALVGSELHDEAKKVCDEAIHVDNFQKYQEKKAAKKLASSYDFFIGQATIMPKIASSFGRVFGPRGKMPNPKAGCVVPPNAALKPLFERLQKTIHLQTKNDPIISCSVGKEDAKDEEIIDNIMTIYNSVVHALPNDINNIRSVYLKFTMGRSVRIDEKISKSEEKEEKKKSKKGEKKVDAKERQVENKETQTEAEEKEVESEE